jgi:hypothetical protein
LPYITYVGGSYRMIYEIENEGKSESKSIYVTGRGSL